MFVGETGVGRIVQRACDLMKDHKTENTGATDGVRTSTVVLIWKPYRNILIFILVFLPIYLARNYPQTRLPIIMPVSKDVSEKTKINDDHLLHDSSYSILELNNEKIVNTEVPALNAVNERLRDDYIKDCDLGVRRWNKIIEDAGIDFRLKLPHRAFHRGIGQFSEIQTDPEGEIITQSEWDRRHSEWLPSQQDQAYVQYLMQPVTEPGKIAGWIAPPKGKINRHPFEYEFVRFN